MKINKNDRLKRVNDLNSQTPLGRKGAFKKMIHYRLAENYETVLTESQLTSFFSSGYFADIIIQPLQDVFQTMLQEEETFNAKIQELQNA